MLQAHNSSAENNARPHDGYHFIVEGASVLDGTGRDAFTADVGVIGDRIAAVGHLARAQTRQRIDGRGLTLAPGFIDCHSHDDYAVIHSPDMQPKVSQGVTTVVNGNCGLSLAPRPSAEALKALPAPLGLFAASDAYAFANMREYRAAVEAHPAAVNVVQLVGHGTLRAAFVADPHRAATPLEISAMSDAIEHAMEAGCLGLSAGLAYASSSAATTAEVIALAQVVAAREGVFTLHLRDEGVGVIDSVTEAIQIARESGVATVLSHHKCVGKNAWGLTTQTLAQITAARLADTRLKLDIDCYPYTASSTVLMMARVATATRTVLTHSLPHPEMAGCDLAETARQWGVSIEVAIEKLSPAGAIYFNLDEDDLLRVLKFPNTMIGSDGLVSQTRGQAGGQTHNQAHNQARPHPRLFGTFPRVLGHYVRERQILSLPEAVHRMTGVPAQVFGLQDRGVIREGAFADLVLFNAATIIDRATFDAPATIAEGIERVWVNGSSTWDGGGSPTRPGRWLTRVTH
jgi:N-acyl-D-amino-acid deacylase